LLKLTSSHIQKGSYSISRYAVGAGDLNLIVQSFWFNVMIKMLPRILFLLM